MALIPLLLGPWKALDAEESKAFLERLGAVLDMNQGEAAFTRHLPISGLRALPLAFYPGWLIVEGEALLPTGDVGTFDVLYGPGFIWVIDGDSQTLHDLNAGRIPDVSARVAAARPGGLDAPSSVAFVPSPLVALDERTTGPDYLRFFCSSVWGDDGPFWPVEAADSPLLVGADEDESTWRGAVKPMTMERVDGVLKAQLVIAYGARLFEGTLTVDDTGSVRMVDDKEIASGILQAQRYRSPFRNLQAGVAASGGARP